MPHDAGFTIPGSPLTRQDRISVLLEEYKALYGLLTFRLSAMDRRLPVVGGSLWALLSSTTAMPSDAKLCFLLGLPAALLWLLLSTVQHALSKEDHLRRIDEIERLVNALAGEELLVFQSRHPNHARHPGGRTGSESVIAILSICLILLGACVHLIQQPRELLEPHGLITYVAYLIASGITMLCATLRLATYRYRRPAPHNRVLFEAHGLGAQKGCLIR